MDVGMATIFQNMRRTRSDYETYQGDLALAERAEELGFDSLWTVEHHFTGYTMCPSPTQFLSYMAGQTDQARLGSMVIVLPWHDPIRVAEEVAMLDNLSDGRMVLGLGRGLARAEFEGYRVDMEESRARFVEYAEMILEGLEKGYCEYDGEFIQQPRKDLRPEPVKSFEDRTYAAAVSPESMRIMAELGIGLLIIPQKPWEEVAEDLDRYRTIFKEEQGTEPPSPTTAAWVFCDPDEDRAYEMAREYIGGYYRTVLDHYELDEEHLKDTSGYEYYGGMQDQLEEQGKGDMIDFFLSLQVWGTPQQCYEQIVDISEKTSSDRVTGVFSYSGMPYEDCRSSMELFAEEVLPALKDYESPVPSRVMTGTV